jgi:hypothetical protein
MGGVPRQSGTQWKNGASDTQASALIIENYGCNFPIVIRKWVFSGNGRPAFSLSAP